MEKKFKCDQENCKYETKNSSDLKKHKVNAHNIDVDWKYCEHCNYKCKHNSNLKSHKANIHNIDVEWFPCDQGNCNFKCKSNGHLTKHKAYIHDINVKWFLCDQENCNYKFKGNSELKSHKARAHDIDVKWFLCDQENCINKYKSNGDLKDHKAYIHDIDVKWFLCDQENCNDKFKSNYQLKIHKTNAHNMDVMKWFPCDQENCINKYKSNSQLKEHKAGVHDIDVKWFLCDQENCINKYKSNSHLTRHKERAHDIGNYTCDFCDYNRNSHIPYKDKIGKHHICRKCYRKATGKESRIEHIWSNYLDKHIGTEYLLSSDKSLKSQGGCQLYRPDKLYIGIDSVEIDECDEDQHKYNNGNYECDEKRISDIYDENGISGKNLIVIRWNPDNYEFPKKYTEKYTKKLRQERLELCVKLKKYLRENPPQSKIHIFYMFYSKNNHRISENYQVTMIYDESDFIGVKF